MFNISQEAIKDGCHSSVYHRGLNYFKEGRIKKLMYLPGEDKYLGTVQGSKNYTVEIWTDKQGEMANYFCSCPAFDRFYGYCKHVVAVLLALHNNHQVREERERFLSQQMIGEILNSFSHEEAHPSREVTLEPTLIFDKGWQRLRENRASVSLSIGEDRLYVVKSVKNFLEKLQSHVPIEFGKKFTYDPRVHFFRERDLAMLSLFREVLEVSEIGNTYGYGSYRSGDGPFSGKTVQLPETLFKRWLRVMESRAFSAIINDVGYDGVVISGEDLPLGFSLEEKDDRLYLLGQSLKGMVPLTGDGEYFFSNGRIYHLSPARRQNLMPFYRSLTTSSEYKLMIPGEQKERLISELLPRIKKAGALHIPENLSEKIEEPPLKSEIYLDTDGGRIIAEIKFIYGDRVINPFAGGTFPQGETKNSILIRDSEQEKKVMAFFENSGFHVLGNEVYLEDEGDIFAFVEGTLPELTKEGEVFFSESFRRVTKKPSTPSFTGRVSLNREMDLLELDFGLEGIEAEELYGLFSALKEKKKYYRLRDGAFLPLVSPELEDMAEFFSGLELKKEDFAQGHLALPAFRSLYLDSIMEKSPEGIFQKDEAFRELVRQVRRPEETDYPLPSHLEGVLRDYQKTGFKWLRTLGSYGFGGILADDMGLGKTLETISFIVAEREEDPRPALVIAPTSVIFNWQAEINRFSPGLTTLVVTGSKQERTEMIERLRGQEGNEGHEGHVVITSYPLIRNDISLYEGISFSMCILDEAQYIKNAGSLTARSVKVIPAKKRFALTGTPIENSLAELWSIFDFLMPGYLPSFKKFSQKYMKPGNGQDNAHLEELSKKVSPFILRRLKKDVVRELPEKIEQKMVSELTREQKKVYLAYLEKIKQDIAEEIGKNGFDKSRIKILAGLTRLRQICCHPSLFLENFHGESGKLMQLTELLTDLRAGGHRTLLFSQFTSMLAIIRSMLDREGYKYFYLDGSVDSRERVAMADAFNQGEEDLFLISLKAGGTGLNLTGADTVIHFDPWWNPAVEDQATDRAHRIGQDKVVNVMKLISLGTIEERIYELQQRKKNLINEVIKPGETFLTQLSEKEIKEILEM